MMESELALTHLALKFHLINLRWDRITHLIIKHNSTADECIDV